jgi:hypothetical protein
MTRMNKTESYRQTLKTLVDWEPYLLQESGLPGPRGNIELAQVVADEGNRELFERLLAYTPNPAKPEPNRKREDGKLLNRTGPKAPYTSQRLEKGSGNFPSEIL